jgi:hypothetical protein
LAYPENGLKYKSPFSHHSCTRAAKSISINLQTHKGNITVPLYRDVQQWAGISIPRKEQGLSSCPEFWSPWCLQVTTGIQTGFQNTASESNARTKKCKVGELHPLILVHDTFSNNCHQPKSMTKMGIGSHSHLGDNNVGMNSESPHN